MSVVLMILSAAAIILAVRFGLLRGLDQLGSALNWSVKTRGQATGYATSVPEFVCLVAAGLAGVWEAGLWNIASSNIINGTLMGVAVVRYGQVRDLFHRRFVDEIGFALAAIAVPIVLMFAALDRSVVVVPVLLGFFVLYRVVDRLVNAPAPEGEVEEVSGSLGLGLVLVVAGLVATAVAGIFLGDATKDVVNQMGVHPAAAGWILGFCTSLPEMVTFFSVYAAARRNGELGGLADTQEALDNLTASNMANVGLIYPIGLGIFLFATV
jgi:Ca2+/Na+ antiporter